MSDTPPQSDEEAKYKEIFDLLSTNTEEYDNFIAFLEREILPQLPSHQHFLDIGAGRGNIVKAIARHFASASIVEPNSQFFGEIMNWADTAYPQLQGHNSFWENVKLDATAELVMLSHVLYYVPLENRQAFIRKAYDALSPQGCMIIALYGRESDTWKLSQLLDNPEILPSLPYAEKLHNQLTEWGYTSSFHPFESHIITQNEEQMRLMIDFLLLGRISFDEEKSAIRDQYIQQHLRGENDYTIRSGGGIIVITKPAPDKDQVFRDEFEILSLGTDEYAFTIPKIQSDVIAKLAKRESYLDIGAGHGNLTRHFVPHFRETVIVEPNPVLFQELMAWAKDNGHSMSGYNSVWDASVNIEGRFDFALISHVLYHIPPNERQGFISHAFDLLRENGQLVIVTVAEPESEIGHLYRSFLTAEDYKTIPYAHELQDDLLSWGYTVENIPFYSDIRTETEAEMEELIDFLLIQRVDFTVPETNAALKKFIAQKLRKAKDYAVASPGAIIIVKK